MAVALSARTTINNFIRDHGSIAEEFECNISNYSPASTSALISQIIVPILENLRELSIDAVPDRKDHLKHIKEYPKKASRATKEDHDEKVMRALSDKGIIGEFDAESLCRRKVKVEWACCLDIIERLGGRLGTMMKLNLGLGDILCLEVVEKEPAYLLALHLLKVLRSTGLADKST